MTFPRILYAYLHDQTFPLMSRLSVLLCSLCFSLAANAQVLVHEPFDYAPKNPIWCSDGGTGWDVAWSRLTGDDAIYEATDLDTAGTAMGTHALLPFELAGMRYNRNIPLIADDGQSLWMSVWMDFAAGANPNNVGNITLLRNGDQVYTVGRKFGNERFGFVWPGATGYNTDVPTAGLHWVVTKIEFSGDNGAESAYLWIDPAGVDAENPPALADADLAVTPSSSPALRLNAGINGVQLKNEGTPPLFLGLDELLLGRTFADVAPTLVGTREVPALTGTYSISPNPTDGDVQVQFTLPQADRLQFRVVDGNGRVVFRRAAAAYAGGTHRLQLPLTIPSGHYFLRISNGRAATSLPLIRQ